MRLFDGRHLVLNSPEFKAMVFDTANYAEYLGQALFIFTGPKSPPINWPRLLRSESIWGRPLGMLFDTDRNRLKLLAIDLGLKRVIMINPKTKYQHIDLCAHALQRVINRCENKSDFTDNKNGQTHSAQN
jgi:hypothetical protein